MPKKIRTLFKLAEAGWIVYAVYMALFYKGDPLTGLAPMALYGAVTAFRKTVSLIYSLFFAFIQDYGT